MEKLEIADRLDALASMLELGKANRYTTRDYRGAAETIRRAPLPVAELVSSGRSGNRASRERLCISRQWVLARAPLLASVGLAVLPCRPAAGLAGPPRGVFPPRG